MRKTANWALAVLLLVLIVSHCEASASRVEQRVEGLKSIGFGSTDVDISECLSSWSILFGLYQDVKVNALCVADKLNQAGKYQAAAEMKCSVRRVRKVYGDDCIDRVRESAPVLHVEPLATKAPDEDDEDEYKALRENHAQLEAEIAQARKDAQRARVEAQRAYERPIMQPDLQQQLSMDAIRRANSREILKGEK